ncbi:MAG TPA: glycosyltransferase family 9 protein [Vicinamibacterales bacterium]|nr:glycosyltransferase family 9 protein [Vicinamibacterales bacterium]
MSGLQIPNPRERALVRAADIATAPFSWFRTRSAPAGAIRRVLLLRLERIGDLLMVLDAISEARAAWPDAEIDLAVGSWNLQIAKLVGGVTNVHVLDVPWLARGDAADGWPALIRKARAWRSRSYDLAINFEPDIRSNFLMWQSGARARHGYWTGGGRAFLTDAIAYEPEKHVSVNARTLVARAADMQAAGAALKRGSAPAGRRLVLPPDAKGRAIELVGQGRRPLVGVHASGGRESKQWHLDRFADVARELARQRNATIVLTGSESDRPLVDKVAARLGGVSTLNLCGELDLVDLAAVLASLDVFVTGDTGPMHLASAVSTPVVALFGPADPRRYGPTSPRQRVIRVDLPCSPCGMVRLPPERCRGHVPDCMDGIQVGAVVKAALDLLDETVPVRQTAVD